MSTYLITGATGGLGRAAVDTLLQTVPAAQIAVLVRDSAKAADLAAQGVVVRQGDYDDYASLTAALAGVEKVLLVSGSDVAHRIAQHTNVVNAAKEAGVQHVVYTSIPRQSATGSLDLAFVVDSHLATERLLQASGLAYTILQNTLYLEVLPLFMGPVLETGTLYLPAGEGRVPYASRADLGTAAGIVLSTPGHENQSYALTGPHSYSFADIAQLLSELSGKAITYVSPTAEEFVTQLAGAMKPAEIITLTAGFMAAIAQGELAAVSSTLAQLLGREPEGLREFLKQAYQL